MISRDEARAAGLKRYFTGEPCRNGHVAERYVGNNEKCVECVLGRVNRYRSENLEERRDYDRRRRISEGERLNESQRNRRAADPEKVRKQDRDRRAADIERHREQERAWCAANRDRIGEQRRYRYASDPEKYRAKARAWLKSTGKMHEYNRVHYAKDPEKRLAVNRQWRADNPEKVKESYQQGRRRIAGERAAKMLTELTGIPHEALETVDANGKKTWQPAPIKR